MRPHTHIEKVTTDKKTSKIDEKETTISRSMALNPKKFSTRARHHKLSRTLDCFKSLATSLKMLPVESNIQVKKSGETDIKK